MAINAILRPTAALACLLAAAAASGADTERHHGSGDTSRHPARPPAHARPPAFPARDGPQAPPPAPATGYWSDKCARQRASSLGVWGHTPDCDNPAYTGGYYPAPYGYGYGPRPGRPGRMRPRW
jgi:hypothetical protein